MSQFSKAKLIVLFVLIFTLITSYAKEKINIEQLPMKPILTSSSETNWFKKRFSVTWNELVATYNKDEIEVFFKRWKSLYPNDPEAWINYANWKAAQSKKEVVNVNPNKLGSFELKVNDGTIESHGIEGQGDDFISSEIYIDESILSESINLHKKALKRFPYRMDIYLYLSKSYDVLEEYEKQLQLFQTMSKKVTSLTHDVEFVNYSKIGKEEALFLIFKDTILNLYKKNSVESNNALLDLSFLMTKVLPNNAVAWNYLVAIYDRLGNKKSAYKAAKKAYSLNPRDDIIVFNLAVFSIELGFREEAIKHYKWILKNGKQDYMIKQAKKDLKLLLGE